MDGSAQENANSQFIGHHGISMVRVGRAALKGCAARTRKRASALDRVPAAKRRAMVPLWGSACCCEFWLTSSALM
jgi:hypothetical protein